MSQIRAKTYSFHVLTREWVGIKSLLFLKLPYLLESNPTQSYANTWARTISLHRKTLSYTIITAIIVPLSLTQNCSSYCLVLKYKTLSMNRHFAMSLSILFFFPNINLHHISAQICMLKDTFALSKINAIHHLPLNFLPKQVREDLLSLSNTFFFTLR